MVGAGGFHSHVASKARAMETESQTEVQKASLRTEALARRGALEAGDRAEMSRVASAFLSELVGEKPGASKGLYWPIRDEIDCKPALISLMDAGHAVALPVVLQDGAPLQFRLWEYGAQLFEAGFGTLAPGETAVRLEPEIIVIPLLGFDKAGTRLGYGKGYYDRTLARMKVKPMLVGFAFSVQELDYIPAQAHDVPIDWIVTEDGVRRMSS